MTLYGGMTACLPRNKQIREVGTDHVLRPVIGGRKNVELYLLLTYHDKYKHTDTHARGTVPQKYINHILVLREAII